MNNAIFSIYDSKADYYMPFFCERNDNTALRAVEAALADPQTPLAQHPGSYSLFYIGQWDPEKGTIETPGGPRHVADCWTLKPNTEKND